jgi:hypothetical protein
VGSSRAAIASMVRSGRACRVAYHCGTCFRVARDQAKEDAIVGRACAGLGHLCLCCVGGELCLKRSALARPEADYRAGGQAVAGQVSRLAQVPRS